MARCCGKVVGVGTGRWHGMVGMSEWPVGGPGKEGGRIFGVCLIVRCVKSLRDRDNLPGKPKNVRFFVT